MRVAMNIVLVLGLMSSAASYADAKSESAQSFKKMMSHVKSMCQPDIKQYCSDVTPGDGRVAACLDSKEDKLSASCKSARVETKANISKKMDKAEVALRKDCGSDIQKFCAEVPSGGGRILDCLALHDQEVSSSCQKFQAKLDQKLAEFLG